MKLWILGASGMLGSALKSLCVKENIEHIASDRIEADITDLEGLEKSAKTIRPTHIVNCAAFTDVDGAEKQGEKAYLINATGPENIGKVAKRHDAKVIHLSTDYVFDGQGSSPYLESDPCAPINVYGMSKREGEMRLLDQDPTACLLRTSWLFGPKGKNFISSILSFLQKQEEVKVATDQRGRPTFCKDLAKAILSLTDASGIFHFANANDASRYEIAQEIYRAAKQRNIPLACKNLIGVSASEFKTVARRPSYSVLSLAKIEAELGRPVRPWQEALGEYFQEASVP